MNILKYKRSASASALSNIGDVYKQKKQYPKALEYYKKTLMLDRKTGDKKGRASVLFNLGEMYRSTGESGKAQLYYDSSLTVAKQIGDKGKIKDCYKNLAEIYAASGDFIKAYRFHQLYFLHYDSIFNEESNKHLLGLQTKY